MFSEVQGRLDDLNTVMQENLAGVRVVKAFVRADREIGRFGKANNHLMDQTIRAARAVAVTFPGIMLIVNLGIAGAIWFGGVQVTVGELQTGELIAFVNYLIARTDVFDVRQYVDDAPGTCPGLRSPHRRSHGKHPQGQQSAPNQC